MYLKDSRGWYYRYSHLHTINESIRPGRVIDQGTEIGLLGKKGASGGWSHLHFEIKCRQPSGKWGTQVGYAFLWEAYRNQYKPRLVANTRRKSFLMAGEDATLDGSKSWSATDTIRSYEWTFTDGTTASGLNVTRTYETPGVYSEVLKVTDQAAISTTTLPKSMFLIHRNRITTCHESTRPTGRRSPIESTNPSPSKFVRLEIRMATKSGTSGDGSPAVSVKSDGNADKQAKDGYAITHHSYEKPGDYIVTVTRRRNDGVTATTRLHVKVGADKQQSHLPGEVQ